MEIHKYLCDCCGEELDKKKFTITQNYSDSQWDGLDEEFHRYSVNKTYHLCPKCWEKVASLIIKA